MAARTKNDKDLLQAIEAEEAVAYGRENDELSQDRAKAIDYYFGRPYGNEVDGRSQVVTREVMDTIEWIKPSLLRVFTGGDEVCRFEPVGPEDEEAAKQETDYINHVLLSKNPWFHTCYAWFTDALLTKNAYCLAYWDKKEDVQKETYEGLSDDQMALILQDESIEVIGHAVNPVMDNMGQPIGQTHVVQVRRKRTYGCVKLEVLPPERCLVSFRTKGASVRDADFFEYWDDKTLTELRSLGFDVPDDIEDAYSTENSIEDQARNQYREHAFSSDIRTDKAMRMVRVRVVWVRYDSDGDGIAEYRQCVVVGNTILSNQEVNGIPVAAIVPTPVPHRHPGLSVADFVMDLQKIKSTILRQGLDNGYLSNNGRYAISDKVNLDDMLTSRPGGVVRVDGAPSQEIFPLVHPQNGQMWIQMMEYVDQIRENRTGTNRYFTGIDQNALNKTASGIAQLTSSSAQRVEAIARIFAEGVKELCLVVHELVQKHATQEDVVKLRGKWITVDPRQWIKRGDMTISVGLGSGSKESQISALMNILMAQKEAAQVGIASPTNIYNALTELTKVYGFQSPEKFWTDPATIPPKPPEPSIDEQKLMFEAKKHEDTMQFETGKAIDESQRAKEEMLLKAGMHPAQMSQGVMPMVANG